jgi:hypothetical protein
MRSPVSAAEAASVMAPPLGIALRDCGSVAGRGTIGNPPRQPDTSLISRHQTAAYVARQESSARPRAEIADTPMAHPISVRSRRIPGSSRGRSASVSATAGTPMHDIFHCAADTADQAATVSASQLAAGFIRAQRSLVIPDGHGNAHLPHDDDEKTALRLVPAGVANGLLGGALGLYAGLTSLLIPGLGLFAVGPLALLFSSAAAGAVAGAVIGSVTCVLVLAGMPEAEAKRFEALVRAGTCLLVVHTTGPSELRVALEVFAASGIGAVTVSPAG